jgi:sugar lactone lactonase YvrE
VTDLAHDIRRAIDDAAPPVTLDEVRTRHHPQPRPTRTRILVAGLVVLVVLVGTGLLVTLGPRSAPGHRPVITTLPSSKNPPSTIPATVPRAPLESPAAMAMEPDGALLIANQGTNQILRRSPDGHFSVVAGTGIKGFSGDGGPATEAELDEPNGIAVASNGSIYVADTGNNRIRAIAPDGVITTVAGNGTSSDTEEQGTATHVEVSAPQAVAIGPNGDLDIADVGIQTVSADGTLTTLYPGGVGALTVGGTPQFFDPDALAFDRAGDLYVANSSPKEIFEIEPAGTTTEVPSYVTTAGLVTAPDGTVIVGDYGSFGIDRIVDTQLSPPAAFQLSPIATFKLNSIPGLAGVFRPSGVAVAAGGEVYADTDGTNGGTDTPALISIDPDGHVHLLATGVGTGTVVGMFDGMGNTVTRHGGVPSAGRLTLTDGPTTVSAVAGSDGVFAVSVPPGIYRVTGRDQGQTGGVSSCGDADVRVVAGQVTHITVTCVFH